MCPDFRGNLLQSQDPHDGLRVFPLYRVECPALLHLLLLALAQPTCTPQRSVRHPVRMRHLHASAATSPHASGSRPEDFHLSKFFKVNVRGIWHAHCYIDVDDTAILLQPYGLGLPIPRRAAHGNLESVADPGGSTERLPGSKAASLSYAGSHVL